MLKETKLSGDNEEGNQTGKTSNRQTQNEK